MSEGKHFWIFCWCVFFVAVSNAANYDAALKVAKAFATESNDFSCTYVTFSDRVAKNYAGEIVECIQFCSKIKLLIFSFRHNSNFHGFGVPLFPFGA